MDETSPRGIFKPDGKPVLSTPTPEQITAINNHPKAEYFSTLGQTPEVIAKWSTHFGLHRIPGILKPYTKPERYYFDKHVINPLWARIDAEFGDRADQIGVRGTAAAIFSGVRLKDGREVRSLKQILKEGSDTGDRKTNIAGWNRASGTNPVNLDRDFSKKYARTNSWVLRKGVLEEDDDQLIYPLMLVYDLSKMQIEGWDAILPEDPKEREDAILKAYILDYPH